VDNSQGTDVSPPLVLRARKSDRRKVTLGAMLAHPDGSFCISCQIKNLSPRGTSIRLKNAQDVPDRVYLLDTRTNLIYDAQVKWRRSPNFGLEFRHCYLFSDAPTDELRRIIAAL
jgi:hypothetical protein